MEFFGSLSRKTDILGPCPNDLLSKSSILEIIKRPSIQMPTSIAIDAVDMNLEPHGVNYYSEYDPISEAAEFHEIDLDAEKHIEANVITKQIEANNDSDAEMMEESMQLQYVNGIDDGIDSNESTDADAYMNYYLKSKKIQDAYMDPNTSAKDHDKVNLGKSSQSSHMK